MAMISDSVLQQLFSCSSRHGFILFVRFVSAWFLLENWLWPLISCVVLLSRKASLFKVMLKRKHALLSETAVPIYTDFGGNYEPHTCGKIHCCTSNLRRSHKSTLEARISIREQQSTLKNFQEVEGRPHAPEILVVSKNSIIWFTSESSNAFFWKVDFLS